MIRLDYYVRRKPDLSVDEFQERWHGSHAEIWKKHADILGLRRLIQVADMPDDPIAVAYKEAYDVGGEAYDGVSHAYWAEVAVLAKALETEEGRAAWSEILEDEKQFIDTSRSMISFGVNHPVINPRGEVVASKDSEIMKGIYFPPGLPHLSIEEIQRQWIAVHCGLTHENSFYSPNIRYFQVHATEAESTRHLFKNENAIITAMRKDRNIGPRLNHFGHAEVWSSMKEFEHAGENPRRQELFPLFQADIESFSDPSKSYFIIGKEHFVVNKDIYTMPIPVPPGPDC